MAAPPSLPLFRPRSSAAVSISSPRAVLMRRAPFLSFASVSRLMMWRVSAVDGAWSEIRSARASRSSRLTSSAPPGTAASGERNGSAVSTVMSNARARWATSRPMRPKPTRPSVRPDSSSPVNFDFSHWPTFIEASAAARCRTSASANPMRQLGDADAVRTRGVDDQNAARGCRVDVNRVDAGAGARDHAKLRRLRDERARHFGRASHDQRIGGRERGVTHGGVLAGGHDDRPPRPFQAFDGRRRKLIGDDDVHGTGGRRATNSLRHERAMKSGREMDEGRACETGT